MPTRTFGLPFRGFDGATRRWQCPLDVITGSSYDWMIDPTEGKLIRRGGSYLLGQAIKDANEVTLQFEAATYNDMYARQIIELPSDSITDGLPTHCVLYSNDATAGLLSWMSPNTYTVAGCSMTQGASGYILSTVTANGFQDVTLGARVQITGLTGTAQAISAPYNNGGGANTAIDLSMECDANITTQTATIGGPIHGLNMSIGRRFSTTHYPNNLKVVPVIGVTKRLKTAAERALVAKGSRRVVQVNGQLFMGNCVNGHVPMRWNGLWNDQSSSGTANERYFPMGNIPPLWMMVADGGGAISGPNPQWASGKTYFFSMMFRYADGSYSQPFVPQYKKTAGNNFFGYHEVVTPTDTLTITMPIGPAEVEARIILRTVAGSLTVPPALVDPDGNSLLGVAAIIENNTATSYSLKVGNDLGLTFDPVIVRFDRIWAPPTRFLWTGDQRIWGAYTRPLSHNILICPKTSTYNTSDDNAGMLAATARYVETSGIDGLITAFVFDTTVTVYITGSVQDVVDAINLTTNWAAGLVPGADGSQAATTALAISGDYGDASAATIRVYNNAWPAMLALSSDWFTPIVQSPYRRRIWFSIGGPGTRPNGPDTSVKNFREGPLKWGVVLGGASLLNGQVVCFTNAIAVCRNIRDVKTGLDDDFELVPLNESRGCISDASITSGDGWVGYMTRDGYVVTDGEREVILTNALYNPATGQGILADPIKNCISALGTNDGEACARYATAWVADSKLFLGLSYAATSPSIANDPVMAYDYSAGAPGAGLAEILRPDGSPWGWSAPLSVTPNFPGVRSAVVGGAIGRLKDSGAGRRMVVASSYLGTTAPSTPHGFIARILEPTGSDLQHLDLDGTTHTATATVGSLNLTAVSGDLSRIAVGATIIADDNVEVRRGSVVASVSGTTVVMDRTAKATGAVTVYFQGKDIEPAGYMATDLCGTHKMKSLKHLTALYNQAGAGMEIQVTNELDRTGQVTFALPAAASADGFSRQRLNVTQALRGLSKGYEPLVVDRGTTTQQSEFWGLEAEVDILDSHR